MSQFDSVWERLDETVASEHVPGLVAGIRHRDETEVYATGYRTFGGAQPMESTTPFRIASLSKLVAGALAVTMIDDGIIAPDQPVAKWLPELGKPKVLVDPAGPLTDTLPAERPITVEHLLTLTNGIGVIFEETPLSEAIEVRGVAAGAIPPQMTPDAYMKQIAALPLAYQPGERFLYNMGTDILSVLLARAGGKALGQLVQERITDPLAMTDTGFWADGDELPTMFQGTPDGIQVTDEPHGRFASPPRFETLAGGLVSTVPDYLKFLSALADGTLLPRELQKRMISNQLTDAQRKYAAPILDKNESWGWQTGFTLRGRGPGQTPGSFGWQGGSGTIGFVDPKNDLVACCFSQRMMAGPSDGFDYFMEPLAKLR